MTIHITRRDAVQGGASLALAACVGGPAARAADADKVDVAELMQPSPLGDIALGADNAPVTIVEYASMTCSHCADFSVKTLPVIKERYIDTGKVRYILREFPLDPLAVSVFMLARCAGPEKYYPFVETMFQQFAKWAVPKPYEPLLALAKQAGFTEDSFKECLSNQKMEQDLNAVRQRASEKFKVESTPTFFINGERVRGAMPVADFEKMIEKHLKG